MKSYYFCSLGIILLTNCFSSHSEDIKELDIPLKKETSQQAVDPEQKKLDQDAVKDVYIEASYVIDWQKFFKPSPTDKEKKQLETTLETWKDQENADVLIKKGRNHLAVGQVVAGETAFLQALRVDRHNFDAMLELAQIYIKQNKLKQAFEMLSDIRKNIDQSVNDPSYKEKIFIYRYVLALAYLTREDIKLARNVLSDLVALDKTFSPAYAALASSYLKQNKLKIAEFVAKQGLDRGKENPALYNILGVVAKREGKFDEARQYFNKALTHSPQYAPALVNRATIAIFHDEHEAAEHDLIKAISADPLNVTAHVTFGILQKRLGKHDSAKAAFQKAIDINPDNAYARLNLGILMIQNYQQPNVALRLFHEVLQTHGDEELVELAKLYIEDIRENRLP